MKYLFTKNDKNEIVINLESEEGCEVLLEYFLGDYRYKGDLYRDVIPKLIDLINDNYNAELPNDWGYFWGVVCPRKSNVWIVDKEDWPKIALQRESQERFAETWEGVVLLDAESIETNCQIYLKIPTLQFLEICRAWEDVK